MKKIILSLVAIATISLSSFGQAPEGFKYQAVVRDAGGLILNNQAVGMRLTVQQGSIGGTAVYAETFSPTTNAYGLVNLEIGTGTTTDDFTSIDWANGPYFMETAVDFLGGMTWVVMGTSQLMSVPYALYAKTAENVTNDLIDDADADPTNELQDWSSLPGIPAELADGTDDVDDADADPTNELQDWSNLPGIPAELADGTDDVDDADADPTNELQDWSNLPGIPAGLSDGTDDVDDADSDPTNELQDWSNLPGIPAGLSDGIDNVDDADADPTNELQALNLSNDTLYLSNGNNVYIGAIGGSGTGMSGLLGRPAIAQNQTYGSPWSVPGWNVTTRSTGISTNRIEYCPIFVSDTVVYTGLGLYLNTTSADICRIAIYNSDNGLPTTLFQDFGVIDCSTIVGERIITTTFTLTPGYYFIAASKTGTGSSMYVEGIDQLNSQAPVSGRGSLGGQSRLVGLGSNDAGGAYTTSGYPINVVWTNTGGYSNGCFVWLRE